MIPAELKAMRRWCVAQLDVVDGRETKVPYRAIAHQKVKASSTDPSTWSDFATAMKLVTSGAFPWIGFMLHGSGLVGVDFDHCVDGDSLTWATDLVLGLDSYCEFSQSGTGVHVLLRGQLPPGRHRTGKAGAYPPVPAGSEVEMYDAGRYFVTTGHVWQFRSRIQDRQDQITELHAHLFGAPRPAAFDPQLPAGDEQGLENVLASDLRQPLTDDEVLRRATLAKNGEKFIALFRGDSSAYGGDHSSADLALISILMFWTRGDRDQADRLFRQSNLVRPKWTNRADYRDRTFQAVNA